jgi:hypothetical protein
MLLVCVLLGLSACGDGSGSSPAPDEPAGGGDQTSVPDDTAAETTGPAPGTGATLTAADGPLTEEADGARLELAVGEEVSWQLSSDWEWDQPAVDGTGVELVPVDYFDDPGFREWLVVAAAAGTVTLTVEGLPACGDPATCPQRQVSLTVDVTG